MLDADHHDLLRAALDELTPTGATLALDLGCGSGGKTGWMQATRIQDSGFRIQERDKPALIGLDLNRRALVAARADRPAAAWICGDAHALPLTTASIDLIWCVAVLGLLADPLAALREARRVLRPGGTLMIAQATQRWVRLRPPPEAMPLTPAARTPADDLGDDLAQLLQDAGFTEQQRRAYLLEPAGLSAAAAQAPLLEHAAFDPFTEPEALPVLILAAGRKTH